MQKGLMELVFPVGSTYITQSNTNPSTILEFGTWERLKGKVCLGLDEDDDNLKTIGNTGGEKEHVLTLQEMPSHDHQIQTGNVLTTSAGNYGVANNFNTSGTQIVSQSRGGGQAHNNMPPYEVVGYMWIRRS